MAEVSRYRVEIRRTSDDALLRVFDPLFEPRVTYTRAQNSEDNGGEPAREFKVFLYKISPSGDLSEPQIQTISNPAPEAPLTVGLYPTVRGVVVTPSIPSGGDASGMRVWAGVAEDQLELVYQGRDVTTTIPTEVTGEWFFKVALFDSFGTHGLNESGIYSVEVDPLEADTLGDFTPERLQDHLDFAVSGSKNLASGLSTLQQSGYQNDFEDPLFEADGIHQVTSSTSPVELILGPPNQARVSGTLLEGERANLVLGPRHQFSPGIHYMVACEVYLGDNTPNADLLVTFYDENDTQTGGPILIASAADGERAAGFVDQGVIPYNTAFIEVSVEAAASEYGVASLGVSEVLAAQTGPKQEVVPAFVDPKNASVSRYLELSLIETERALRTQGLEYRANEVKAAISILQEVTADAARYAVLGEYTDGEGTTRALISLLAANGVSEILLAAGVLAFVNDLPDTDPVLAMEMRGGVVSIINRLDLTEQAVLLQTFGANGHVKLGFLDGTGASERRGFEIVDGTGQEIARFDDGGAARFNGTALVASSVFRGALAANAASRTVSGYQQEHDVWPTGFGPSGSIANKGTNDAGTNWPSKSLEIKPSASLLDVKAGSPVLIWVSYKLTSVASSYAWMYFEHELFRRSAGGGIPNRVSWPSGATDVGGNPYTAADGLIEYEPLFDGIDSGNQHVSGNMGSNAIRRVKPGLNGLTLIDIPSADGDYDYWFRWQVDDRYAFAVDGFETPTGTRHPFLSDVRIIVTNLAK